MQSVVLTMTPHEAEGLRRLLEQFRSEVAQAYEQAAQAADQPMSGELHVRVAEHIQRDLKLIDGLVRQLPGQQPQGATVN